MFGPSTPQHNFRQVEQASREHYEQVEGNAARRAQLGIRKPTLRENIRHWYRWPMRRKPAEH